MNWLLLFLIIIAIAIYNQVKKQNNYIRQRQHEEWENLHKTIDGKYC